MKKLLQEIGLSEKESKVYLACLELSKATAFNIAKKSDLKRPTVYLILEDLEKKGLISLEKTQKVTYYSASHPKKLLTNLKNQERKLEDNLINLESLYNLQSKKPIIKTFEGLKNVAMLYDEITDYARLKGKEVLAFGTLAYLGTIHKEQYNYWLNHIKSKKCHIREILNNDKYNKQYLDKIKKLNNPNHKIKFIPENFNYFDNDNLIYDNKVVLFSSHKDFFVIIIESEKFAKTFRTFFELAWKTAKPTK